MSEAVNVKSPIKHINKLVRDKIPELIEANRQECKYKILTDDVEYMTALEAKLQEEVNEYLESRSLEELADIMDVFIAILYARGYSLKDLTYARAEKGLERGEFKKRIFLECVYPKGYSE